MGDAFPAGPKQEKEGAVVIGEHKSNGRALQAAQAMPRFPPGTETLGFKLDTVVELNKEKTAELMAVGDEAKTKGDDPRAAVHAWSMRLELNPIKHPEWFDYVVYDVATLGRPSTLLPDPRQIPTAAVRVKEHFRMPLEELRKRADEAFSGAEATSGGDAH